MFDLDGTLVDSVPDLAYAVDAMLNELNSPKAGIDQVKLWVGNGALMLVKRALSNSMTPKDIDQSLLDKAMLLFYKFYQHVNGSKSRLYSQVFQTLKQLRQETPYLALVTNKPTQFTQPLLDHHGLPDFDLVVCGDTLLTKKPDPAQLLYCLEKLNCRPEEALMVGDSASDIKAAKAAAIKMVCVSYGYNQGENLQALEPDHIINSFGELVVQAID